MCPQSYQPRSRTENALSRQVPAFGQLFDRAQRPARRTCRRGSCGLRALIPAALRNPRGPRCNATAHPRSSACPARLSNSSIPPPAGNHAAHPLARSARMSSTSARSTRTSASSRSIRFHGDGEHREPHHLHRRRQGRTAVRGYPIEQLGEEFVPRSGLPAERRVADRSSSPSSTPTFRGTMINESLLRMFNGFHYNAHPMPWCRASSRRCRRSTTIDGHQ